MFQKPIVYQNGAKGMMTAENIFENFSPIAEVISSRYGNSERSNSEIRKQHHRFNVTVNTVKVLITEFRNTGKV
jgi:hypothetical protein